MLKKLLLSLLLLPSLAFGQSMSLGAIDGFGNSIPPLAGSVVAIPSGVTCTGCTTKAIGYVSAAGQIKFDSTSPQWDPVTGHYTIAGTEPQFVADNADDTSFSNVTLSAASRNFFIWQIGTNYSGSSALDDQAGTTSITNNNGDIIVAPTGALRFGSGGVAAGNERWYIDSANPGNLLAVTDGGPDIGASGANRPNNLFLKGVATLGTSAVAANNAAGNLLMASTDHPVKTFTATYDPGTLAAQTGRTDTVTVTGIKLAGGAVSASPGVDAATGCVLGSVRASADDTVKITWFNAITAVTACDTASSTWTFTQQVN